MSEESNFGRVWAKLKEMNEHLIRIEVLLDSKVVSTAKETPLPLKAQDITIAMLKNGDKDITLRARVSKINAAQSGTKKDSSGEYHFQVFTINDTTKSIDLQLWEDDIETYSWIGAGDEIVIRGAYINSFKDKLQMRISKSGKIEPVEAHEL